MPKTFSLIIPARNSAAMLAKLLPAALSQSRPPDEILVLDNSTSKETADTALALGVRVIPVTQFNHGGTRTMGGKAAQCDILLYMTDDALPASNDCFERLLSGFDGGIAAVYGRQLGTVSKGQSAIRWPPPPGWWPSRSGGAGQNNNSGRNRYNCQD